VAQQRYNMATVKKGSPNMEKENYSEMLRIRCGKEFKKKVTKAAKSRHWTDAQFIRDVLIRFLAEQEAK